MSDHELTVTVNAGSDPRRRERAVQDLRVALVDDPAVTRTGIAVTRVPGHPAPDGAKGTVELVGAAGTLAVLGQWYAPHVADVLKTAIQEWCARDRRVSVTVHDGDRSVSFTGTPDAEQQAVIDRFFGQVASTAAEDSTSSDSDGTAL